LLLALFLIDLAAGLVLFLPLVGRRNAGVKFYRLVFVVGGALALLAAAAHFLALRRDLVRTDLAVVALTVVVLYLLRYPKRLVFRGSAALLAIAYCVSSFMAYHAAMAPRNAFWSIAGAAASVALLGSVTLAMTLGHWYLVVRGMGIEPLKRLAVATLAATVFRIAVVVAAFVAAAPEVAHQIAVREGMFFWMRAGWGLLAPLLLYPMVWGTVKIRSTMAATGILYVDVVAVVIGEVLGAWLSAIAHLPV